MIAFPRPRIPFLIALLLAVPTFGISLAVFYFVFKRTYDSKAVSGILSAAKLSMETRRYSKLFNVNPEAIERVFSKFADPQHQKQFSDGVPFVRWGVLRHPMLNMGLPFSLRVNRKGGEIDVEASPGEAWWLLNERVWLGRQGNTRGLPASLGIKADDSLEENECSDPEDTAIGQLILELSLERSSNKISSLTYGRISSFASRHQLGAEWYPDYAGLYFYVVINKQNFSVKVTNLDPSKKEDGRVEIKAGLIK